MLQQNPSYDKATKEDDLAQQEIAERRAELLEEHADHPHLASPNSWWDKTFASLIKTFGRPRLARRVLSIEYFPYPSSKFGHVALRLPSQDYVFSLVRAGLARGAVFIVTRGLDVWLGAVRSYPNK